MNTAHAILLSLIEKFCSRDAAKKFDANIISVNQIKILHECCIEIMRVFPYQPYSCAYINALLVERARMNGIEAYLVAGTLDFQKKRIFNYDPVVESKDVITNWNGHCWAVFNNVIADLSFFRTMYSEQ